MENYSHFIITRFNLNLYAQDKHDLPTRIEGYKARCPQFEAVYYTAAQAANLTENLRTTIAAYVSCDRKGRKSPPRSC